MRLREIPNLRLEDFPSQQSWIGRLFSTLNPFIASLNQVLSQNIDFTDNIKAVTKDYVQDQVFQAFSFTWPFKDNAPVELKVTKATKGATQVPTILCAAWSYNKNESLITVSKLIEITLGGLEDPVGRYQYTIRVSV